MEKKAREKKKTETDSYTFKGGNKKEDSRSLDEYLLMVFVTLAFILWVEL